MKTSLCKLQNIRKEKIREPLQIIYIRDARNYSVSTGKWFWEWNLVVVNRNQKLRIHFHFLLHISNQSAVEGVSFSISLSWCLSTWLPPHPPPILMLTSTYLLGSKDSKPTNSCPHFNEYAFNMFLLNVNFDKSITE